MVATAREILCAAFGTGDGLEKLEDLQRDADVEVAQGRLVEEHKNRWIRHRALDLQRDSESLKAGGGGRGSGESLASTGRVIPLELLNQELSGDGGEADDPEGNWRPGLRPLAEAVVRHAQANPLVAPGVISPRLQYLAASGLVASSHPLHDGLTHVRAGCTEEELEEVGELLRPYLACKVEAVPAAIALAFGDERRRPPEWYAEEEKRKNSE